MKELIKIRPAKIDDAKMLLPLAKQIGYPIQIDLAKKRLIIITKRKGDILLVAEVNKKVVGFVHGLEIVELLTPKTLRLGGVIVDEEFRKMGIGRTLMQSLEKWAKSNKFAEIIVPSNTKRLGASRFYPKIGYPWVKRQNVFIKTL